MSMDKGVEILRERQIDARPLDSVGSLSPDKLGNKYVRFKDGENEHDDEEEGVGRQNRHPVDALFGYFADVYSV